MRSDATENRKVRPARRRVTAPDAARSARYRIELSPTADLRGARGRAPAADARGARATLLGEAFAADGRLTYLAVLQWYGWSAGRQSILDIGGGSMEIVFGRDAEPELSVSLPLGAGWLTRVFLPDDPPSRR
jgi:exopolyphosphatase / guanosine-5'-triphosphate,3'-diphosphate pyrophosphatase